MDPIAIAAAAGLRSRMESIEILANNLANASTPGFKMDRELFTLYQAPESVDFDPLPLVESHWTDLSQGTLTPTGNRLDLALSGPGFFVVDSGRDLLYTRSGSFRRSPAGQLETQEGYAVRDDQGRKIRIEQEGEVEISADGTLRQDGQPLARLAVEGVRTPAALVRRGSNYFSLSDPAAAAPSPRAVVVQGRLEAANVSQAETAVRLISLLRQFETLQKALTLAGEMGRKTVEEVARVNS